MTQRPPTLTRNPLLSHDDVIDDDDGRLDAIPDPDDAASSSERLRAAQFASLLDHDAAGALPAALALEARHNLEMAVAVQAVAGHHQLNDAEANAMVANVLRNAMAPVVQTPVVDQLAAQRQRKQPHSAAAKSRMPWIIAAASTLVAAAALMMLMLRPTVTPGTSAAVPPPRAWQSRPADALIGAINRAEAGDAAKRMDAIYADRLDGYRNARYAQAGVVQ